MDHISHHLVEFMGYSFHLDTIRVTLVTDLVVIVFAVLLTRNLKPFPETRRQNAIEMLAEFWVNQIESMAGPHGKKTVPIIMTLFVYLFWANQLGLVPGFTSPTNDLNATLGLAVLMVILAHVLGCIQKGFFHYMKHFIEPSFVFLPINLLEECTKPVTLACRLFGNIFAGEILLMILNMLAPLFIPTIWLGFSVFVGLVQALIFSIISITYFANALKPEEQE